MYCEPYPDTIYLIFSAHAPHLLYYSHLPAITVALLLSFFILSQNLRSFSAKVLAVIAVAFSAWSLMDLFIWTQTDSRLVMFLWSYWFFFFVLLFVLSFYFLYVFLKKRDLPFAHKLIFTALLLPIVLLSSTPYNLSYFDVVNCNAVENSLMLLYTYSVSLVIFIWLVFLSIRHYFSLAKNERGQALFASIGVILFLLSFSIATLVASIANFFQSSPDTFALEQYGYFGMTIFIAFLTYAIVQFKAFNIKMIAAQALVAALIVLIGSQFFFIQNPINYILNGITLVLVLGFGFLLVKSVEREVEQREHLEVLTKQLETANDRLKELDRLKSEFLSIASHQLRAPITAIRGYASNIVDGSYGPVPENLKEPLDTMQETTRLMTNSIEDYLNISRIEQGRMKYEKSQFDVADLAKKVVNELMPVANAKKISLSSVIPEDLMITADIGKIKQVITNLTDNAIKYTKQGEVKVSVEKADDKARIVISDTGVGISPEDIGGLFEKFKRARGANQVNTTGTGLGLYVAKQLVEGHGGTVKAESDGEGKGSRFIVELPVS